jgi:hypothetical protein
MLTPKLVNAQLDIMNPTLKIVLNVAINVLHAKIPLPNV